MLTRYVYILRDSLLIDFGKTILDVNVYNNISSTSGGHGSVIMTMDTALELSPSQHLRLHIPPWKYANCFVEKKTI